MTLVDFLKTLRHSLVLIVSLAVLGAIVGFAVSSTNPPKYRSSSSVLVTTGLGNTASDLVQGSTFIEKLVASYALLARSEIVLKPVIAELGLDTTVGDLAGSVSANSTINTVVIDIGGDAASPEAAQELVASVTRHLTSAVREVSPEDADGNPTVRVTTIESASLPSAPFEPNKRLWAVIGGILGLALGVGIAILRRLFADTVTSANDVAALTEVPVVGEIPEARKARNPVAALLNDPVSVDSEAFRGLAANLNFIAVDGGLRSIVVTSGSASESKTTTAVSLALTMAENGARVLLIDGDLRSPSVAPVTGLDGTVGLTSILIGENSLEESVQAWGYEGLDVLTSGMRAPNPAQLLRSTAMATLVQSSREQYDMVIIDSAPILSVTDPIWLGHMVDGVLLTTVARRTRVRYLQRALLALADANVAVVGVVLSRTSRRTRAAYGFQQEERRTVFTRFLPGRKSRKGPTASEELRTLTDLAEGDHADYASQFEETDFERYLKDEALLERTADTAPEAERVEGDMKDQTNLDPVGESEPEVAPSDDSVEDDAAQPQPDVVGDDSHDPSTKRPAPTTGAIEAS